MFSVYGCSLKGFHDEHRPDPAPVPRAGGPRLAARCRPVPRDRQPDVGRQGGARPGRRRTTRGGRARAPAGRDDHPAADRHLARPPRRPARAGRRRDRRRPPHHPGVLGLQPRLRAAATGSPSRCGPTRRGSCRASSWSAPSPARSCTCPRRRASSSLPDRVPDHVLFLSGGSGITPVMSMLRSLQRRTRTAAGSPSCTTPRARTTRSTRTSSRRSAGPATGSTCTCCTPSSATRRSRRRGSSALVPGYRDVPTWACGPAPLIQAVQAAYDGSDALRVEYFKLGSARTATG